MGRSEEEAGSLEAEATPIASAPPQLARPEAILLIGLQGSGKSTFYRERFFATHVRINLDMLRTRRREILLLDACLAGGTPFVVDNTNPTLAARARYLTLARGGLSLHRLLLRPTHRPLSRTQRGPPARRARSPGRHLRHAQTPPTANAGGRVRRALPHHGWR